MRWAVIRRGVACLAAVWISRVRRRGKGRVLNRAIQPGGRIVAPPELRKQITFCPTASAMATTLLELPPELVEAVVATLAPRDVARLSATCQRMCELLP